MLAWIAGQTERIDVGAAVMQIPARTPAMTAMTAATIDALSGGRFRLGLGVSGPQVSEGWHGVRFAKPLARTREYVDIVKLAIARKTVAYDGEHYTLPLPDGPGKALRLGFHPPREHIPIYLAAVGPKNLELAGEIADGWLAIFFAPGVRRRSSSPRSRAGRAKVGKDAGRLRRGADRAGGGRRRRRRSCAELVRWYAALYVGGMGSRRAELLQPARHPDGLRRRRPRGAGPLPGQAAAGRRGRRAAGVHRPHLAARPEGADRRADAGVRRGRRHHAVGEPCSSADRDSGVATLRTVAEALDLAGSRRVTWVEAIVLGIVQGLTEFLPVCSSAHLRITSAIFFAEDAGASFTAVTQLGTEAAVLIYFAKDIWRITRTWFGGLRRHRGAVAASTTGWAGTSSSARSRSGCSVSCSRTRSAPPARNLWLVATTLIVFAFVLAFAEYWGRQTRTLENFPLQRRHRDGLRPGHGAGPRACPAPAARSPPACCSA